MWMTRSKLKERIIELEYRVADLEERLCPCEDHDWKNISSYDITYEDGNALYTIFKYKCTRCGKVKESKCY